jgi:hypothetical protein
VGIQVEGLEDFFATSRSFSDLHPSLVSERYAHAEAA